MRAAHSMDAGMALTGGFMYGRRVSLAALLCLTIIAGMVCPIAFGSSAPNNSQPFSLSLDKPSVQIWGRGTERPRSYPAEFLPGNFSRTLKLEKELAEDITLHWLFTGPRGSLSIEIGRHAVTVSQQYYDSFGLESGEPPRPRFPQATRQQASVQIEQSLNSVTIALRHLTVEVSVNGNVVAHELCLIDLMHHQLFVVAPDSSTGVLRGTVTQPEIGKAHISIDESKTYQTVLGFGGITSIPAYEEMSSEGRAKWWKQLKEYNLLIHREYPIGTKLNAGMNNFDRLVDASPHYYGDNFPNGEISDFSYIKQIHSIGGYVWFEFWALPAWARDAQAGNANPDKYVEAVLAYCRESVAKSGFPPDVIGIQNELIQPGPVWEEMILRLRSALDKAGFNRVKLHMPDAGDLKTGIHSAETLRPMSLAWKALDYSATHVYDFQSDMTDPDSYLPLMKQWNDAVGGKPFLETELTINDSAYQVDSYQSALAMGELYYRLLTVTNAEALAYCWLLLDPEQPSFGFTRSLFTVDRTHSLEPTASGFQLRVFGAFSRHLREGMVRVSADSGDPDLLATAFRSKSGAMTLIFLNRSTAPKEISLPGEGRHTIKAIERASLYRENSVDTAPRGSIVVEPGEIVTVSTVPTRR